MTYTVPETGAKFILTPAPGCYGDRARIISTHRSKEAALKAKGKSTRIAVWDAGGHERKGDEWLRVYEQNHTRIA